MTKADLQQLAEERIIDAKVLLDAGRWGCAFYVAGYAVECGLKACIANLFKLESFPEKTFSDKCYIHDLERLLSLAGLKSELDVEGAANVNLYNNWSTVLGWNETRRYEQKTQAEAQAIYAAITDTPDGVFAWIRRQW